MFKSFSKLILAIMQSYCIFVLTVIYREISLMVVFWIFLSKNKSTQDEYEKYANVDKFGHYKLLAEEQLISSGLNYLIFRAPDVIGMCSFIAH